MKHHTRSSVSARSTLSGRYVKIAILGTVFAVVGLLAVQFYLHTTGAATFAAHLEAESGTVAGAAATKTNIPQASGGSAVSFGGGGKTGGCIAPAGLKVTDLDPDEGGVQQLPPWRHTLGDAAVIYFQTSGLPAEYAGYIADGAAVWNASPCIDIKVVTQCPAVSNCVEARVSNESNTDYDGLFESRGNSYLISGTITMVKPKLDKDPVAYRRLVVAHEMGHAVSLEHRATKTDIMYYASDESAPLVADKTNLNNLLAIYGVKSAATTTPLSTQSAEEQQIIRRYVRESVMR